MLDPSTLFENNPNKRLYFERNTLVFAIFLSRPYDTKAEHIAALREFESYLSTDLRPFIKYYPWYLKPASFKLVPDFRGHSFLYGELEYGDYIPDLWLLTSILFGFSSRDPNLYIRVFDQDGEFLLIEGASQLPAWLASENVAANRVWINDQSIKVIPSDFNPEDSITLENALDFISKRSFKIAKLLDLTEFLSDKLQTTALEDSLHNIFEERVSVSEKMFKLIARNKFYLSNATINYHLEQGLPDLYKLGSKALGDDYYVDSTHKSVIVNIRVSLLAHVYFKKYGGDAEKNGQLLTHLVDRFIAENKENDDIKIDIGVFKGSVGKYNKAVDEDPLQRELVRYNVIEKFVKSIEPNLDDIEMPGKVKVDNPEEMLSKIKKYVNEDDDGSANEDDGSNTDENIKKMFKEEGVSIDEDDFFEFFCKEALSLKPGDLEKMRRSEGEEGPVGEGKNALGDNYDDQNDSVGDARDLDDDDMDVEMITNLLKSLKAEDGVSGPVSSLLRQIGIDENEL